ncbi:GatB/YqeY domain-containing protein [Phaeobacter sp. 11ANDIMAR09]|uniref:GatB/YqeY domain-containing protein n=1 Tax=Phaeobacter sp. 11ANDIMAR09 TaxID=1225647 RepID=UPI0006C83DA3|nr:GatB/YqeY domain-containing protein [Phaeobacter sp. 11ANDIMAR09]KPD13133.1 glutamyl-tRNA amidotransferase [Phaeobacter sp. 11ANDIMAR09]
MDTRTQVNQALKQAMKDKAAQRISTLRLINAAIKDKEIAARGGDGEVTIGDAEVLAILGKMTKQRNESARAYEEGSRLDLAERELEEVAIIEEFLPKQLDEDETRAAVKAAVAETGAASIRDMGKVMGALKAKFTGQLDFGKVGPMVKDELCKDGGC